MKKVADIITGKSYLWLERILIVITTVGNFGKIIEFILLLKI